MCQSIDSPPVCWIKGCLRVENNWERVGIDVTHYNGNHFSTLIDCGPSRYAIWRLLHRQDSAIVVHQLESIFRERDPLVELLMNNDTAFIRNNFKQLVKRWGINRHYRCAYAPAENGIVQRSHRSIKTIATRKRCSMLDAVY